MGPRNASCAYSKPAAILVKPVLSILITLSIPSITSSALLVRPLWVVALSLKDTKATRTALSASVKPRINSRIIIIACARQGRMLDDLSTATARSSVAVHEGASGGAGGDGGGQ